MMALVYSYLENEPVLLLSHGFALLLPSNFMRFSETDW